MKTYQHSKAIKRLIVEKSYEYQIPIRLLCLEVGIEYKKFLASYINSNEENDSPCFTEEQFEGLLKLLGLTPRVQVIIDKDYEPRKVRDILRIKYDTNGSGKKERDIAFNSKSDFTLD